MLLALVVPALALVVPVWGTAPTASAQDGGPLAVVKAYEAAWNARDAGAVASLFAENGRSQVWGAGVDGLESLLPRRAPGPGRLHVPWCPANLVCRIEGDRYQVSGNTVTWNHRLYSNLRPPEPVPWEATAQAVVRDARIVSLLIESTPEWQARRRAAENVRMAEVQATAVLQSRTAATVLANATTVAARATEEALQGAPRPLDTQSRARMSPAALGGAGVAMLVVLALAMFKRPVEPA